MAPIVAVHANVAAKLKRPPPGTQSNTDGTPPSKSSPSSSLISNSSPTNGSRQFTHAPSLNGTTGPRAKTRKDPTKLSLGTDSTESKLTMSTLNQYQLDMERFLLETYSDTPSLIVHLYPKQQHLRFEGQDSVFNFKSPVGSVLIRALRNRTIPHELLPLFVAEDVPFYNGCLVFESVVPGQLMPNRLLSQRRVGTRWFLALSITPVPTTYPRLMFAILKKTFSWLAGPARARDRR